MGELFQVDNIVIDRADTFCPSVVIDGAFPLSLSIGTESKWFDMDGAN